MSSILLDHSTVTNIKADSMQFGLALIMSYLVAGENLFSNDCRNTKVIFITLIGFAVYHTILSKLYVTATLQPTLRVTLDDIIKFATVLYVSKYLGDRENLYTREFGLTTLNLLVGFLIYNSIISNHLTTKLISDNMTLPHVMAISDFAKFTSVFVISGLLNKLSNVGDLDKQYVRLSAGYVAGLVTYDLIFS